MANPGLTDAEMDEAEAAYIACDKNVTLAARSLGIPRSTYADRLKRAQERKERGALENVGYDLSAPDMTPEQAWQHGHGEFERTISSHIRKRWPRIVRPKGPGVIHHMTDPHVDDPGSALRLIEQDAKRARELDAVRCFGGDLLNNWPMAGKLAKKWAMQECTLPMSLLRAQHFLELYEPHVVTKGNHEEMNPYLSDLIDQWLPKWVIQNYWTTPFIVEPKGGRDIRCVLSHKFGKGASWFHKLHGHIREMLEGEEADLLMDGHLHCDGVLEQTLPERGHAAVAVASGGYKLADEYARRISRGGGPLRLRGRCHWIIYDPQAEHDEDLCKVFKSARQAEAYLNGLQNIRAA